MNMNMKKQVFSNFPLGKKILILLSMLIVLVGVVSAKGSSPDVIEVSECMTLDEEGANYVLTQSLTIVAGAYSCITIGNDAITFDLNGFSISGDNGDYDFGISNYGGYDNIHIKNGEVKDFAIGIYANGASDSKYTDLNINADVSFSDAITGIYLSGGSNNVIKKCDINVVNENTPSGPYKSSYGIFVRGSGNKIKNNYVCGSEVDLSIHGSNKISGNTCDGELCAHSC